MDHETKFLSGLIELQYGQEDLRILKKNAKKVGWAKGWPKNKVAFWNAEAFMWRRKISKQKREFISKILKKVVGENNLDLGCGSYSYVPSVGLDISKKMLDFNDHCERKVVASLEKSLPLKKEEFSSVTAVFVLNYVKNVNKLISEVKRVLKPKGKFTVVLNAGKTNSWQAQKEVNNYDKKKWQELLEDAGFQVKFMEKGRLYFFVAKKE